MSFATPATSSSCSSLIEESSNPQRKNKRYVKKKGETRKRNSMEINSRLQLVKESSEIDEISKKLEEVKIKTEKDADSLTRNKDSVDIDTGLSIGNEKMSDEEPEKEDPSVSKEFKSKTGIVTNKKITEIETKGKNPTSVVKEDEKKDAEESSAAKTADKKGQENSLIVEKSITNNEQNKEDNSAENFMKNSHKGKTEEQKKRDRQTIRFVKAVARFSVKFSKAAVDLGIIRPKESSTSWSDSSSSDSSCLSSCTCSDCCTTDSSTCSCSDCEPSGSSSSFSDSSFSSSETSCSTLNSSTSSDSSSKSSSSSSGIISPETLASVIKKFK